MQVYERVPVLLDTTDGKGEKDARLAVVTLGDYGLGLTGYKAKGDLWDGELHPCWHANSSKHILHRSQPIAWR